MTEEEHALLSIRAIIETLVDVSPELKAFGERELEANLSLAVTHIWRIAADYFSGVQH